MFELYDELVAAVDALRAAHVEYAICGGIAMAIWSLPRATVDIDILIQPNDLPRAQEAVAAIGYVVKAFPMSFAGGAVEIRRISKLDPEGGDVLMLDFLLVTPVLAQVWATRVDVEWEHGQMTVVSRDGLIELKSLRGSGRDADDIERLRGKI